MCIAYQVFRAKIIASLPWSLKLMNENDYTGQVIIEENKLPQTCPDWVKISEIAHPALVPGFISRRECLPDGSIDPNTPSVSTQMTLLKASALSPSLASVVGNIPSSLMCESIHRRQIKEAKEEEGSQVFNEGFVITHPPTHYMRVSDPMLMPTVVSATSTLNGPITNTAIAMANQTASELAAMNLLYGGVRGKAYLDSLKSFIDSVNVKGGSKIEELLKDRLLKSEGACGFKILNLKAEPQTEIEIDSSAPLIDQNHQIYRILNEKSLEISKRTVLVERLHNNLKELMKDCPEEIKSEKLKGVDCLLQY